MRTHVRRHQVLSSLLLAALVVLAGCMTGVTSTSGPALTPTAGSTAAATATLTPTPGSLPATVVERHDSTVTVLPGATGFSGAKCSGAGEQMVGGGYYIAAHSINASASYPSSLASWTAAVTNTSTSPMALTAFVDCLQTAVSVDVTIIRGAPVSVPRSSDPTTSQLAAALCPDGTVLTGGGYSVSPTLTGFLAWSAPGTADSRPPGSVLGNDWLVLAHATTAAMTMTSYAVCAAHHLAARVPHPSVPLTIPASGTAGGAEVCPTAGEVLTGGGYAETTTPHSALFDIDSPASVPAGTGEPITKWIVAGTNTSSSVVDTIRIYAICVTVTA